jgi:RES domain-containing protein
VRVWRISRREHAAFDGEGGRVTSGRWHHRGVPVVYTGGSLALAALEFFVHLSASISLVEFVAISADIPDRLKIETLSPAELPAQWRKPENGEALRDAGTEWLRARRSAVLAVPSAVIPIETNYLLNPGHKDFTRIHINPPEAFEFDYRMWKPG